MMKISANVRENIIFVIVLAILILLGFLAGLHMRPDNDVNRKYVDSLFQQSRQTITFDSIRSAIEHTMMDSIRDMRSDLEQLRISRRRQTQIHHRENETIRHRIDSIGPINRPDF